MNSINRLLRILLLTILISYFNLTFITIDKKSRHYVDIEGRVRVFHGVNIVVKNPPYVPIEDHFDPLFSLSEEDYDYLTKFGFNVVRLGIIWEAVETAPGVYNQAYLDTYEKIVNKLGERGIYTILDSHQDMFSRILCGEGVPTFYAKNLLYKSVCGEDNILEKFFHLVGVCHSIMDRKIPVDADGIPITHECKNQNFMDLHNIIELGSIYDSFFKNFDGIQDKFIEYWKVLARKFKGNKYILGYDIWNEPWVGNLFSEIVNFLPGYSTNNSFLPFYQKVNESLRKIDDDFVLMFEEALFPDTLPFLGGLYFGGYKTTPAGDNYLNRQIWSKHHYCFGVSIEMTKHKIIPLDHAKTSCRDYAEYKVRKSYEKSIELGVPVFYTEFGACSDNESCYWEVKALADACDTYMLSWSYWMYKPYGDHTTVCNDDTEGMWNPDGSLQMFKMKALTRPFIMAFQGTPIKSFYYTELNVFNSRYVVNSDIVKPTVLYFNNEIFYKNEYKFVFVVHEFSINEKFSLNLNQIDIRLSKDMIDNFENKNLENETDDIVLNNMKWEDLNSLDIRDHNYLKFKISKNNEKQKRCNDSDNTCSKIFVHEYLGFKDILENTLEVYLVPIINYEVTIMSRTHFNDIEVNIENLSSVDVLLNPLTADNIILITDHTNQKIQNDLSFHYETKFYEDLSNLDESADFINELILNEQTLIKQIYIPKLHIKIYQRNKVHAEITLSNVCNHFIKINLREK